MNDAKDAIWGADCFDNMQAQMLADEFIWSPTPWEIVANVLAKKGSSLAHCQRTVAAAAIVLGADGHSQPICRCQHLGDWLAKHNQSPASALRTAAAKAVERSINTSAKAKWWKKLPTAIATEWQTQAAGFVKLLQGGKRPKPRVLKPISFTAMKKLVSSEIEGREAGTLMRMHRAKDHPNYKQYHVGLTYTDANTTMEMLRCRSVVDLEISLPHKTDVEAMTVPLKLMLRGWASTIVRLEVYVPDSEFYCDILAQCCDELAHLPKLEHIITNRVLLHDDHVAALCRNPMLSVIELSRGRRLTGKALTKISKLEHLKTVAIYDSKITTTQSQRFKTMHPEVGLAINGHGYE